MRTFAKSLLNKEEQEERKLVDRRHTNAETRTKFFQSPSKLLADPREESKDDQQLFNKSYSQYEGKEFGLEV